MRWSLRSFLIVVPILALLLVFLIQYFYAPKPETTVFILGPVTTGSDVFLPPPTDNVIKRLIGNHYANHFKKSIGVTLLIKVEEVESWMDDARIYPLIGDAQLHHRIWLCEFDAVSNDGDISRRVVHLDQNHFHQP